MSDLTVSIEEKVARVVFDRPSALNALSPTLLSDLIELCADLSRNDSLRVVSFEGAGTCFSAGADLPAFLPLLVGPNPDDVADLGRRAKVAIAGLPQITVAAIRGHCVGGGLVLAAGCDVRIAAEDARFVIPELDAGIPLTWGAMEHLVRIMGETVAADLVLTCRPFGADEALRSGLVSRVVAADRLTEELAVILAAVASKPLSVLRATKRQLLAIRGGAFDARTDSALLLSALNDPEALAAGQAYLKKRMQKG
jgi:enoyl-CoA hydratase/carnithine racemase